MNKREILRVDTSRLEEMQAAVHQVDNLLNSSSYSSLFSNLSNMVFDTSIIETAPLSNIAPDTAVIQTTSSSSHVTSLPDEVIENVVPMVFHNI